MNETKVQTGTTTTVEIDMARLVAAAVVSGHGNTKHRNTLRTVYVTPAGVVVATDSYRLVAVVPGERLDGPELVETVRAASGAGFMIPVELVSTAAKLVKRGPATVTSDGVAVTLVAGGQSFTADAPEVAGDYVSFGQLIPDVSGADVAAGIRWNVDYLADMGKIGKALRDRARDGVFVDLLSGVDLLKPTLWKVSTTGDATALYLLMPVRHSA